MQGRVRVPVLIFLKRFPPKRGVTFVAWMMGAAPALYGFAAVLSGSPAAVLWLGVAWSLILVAFVAIASRRRPETGADST